MHKDSKISLITQPAEFLALEPAWRALHARCGTSVFASWEWAAAWWEHYGVAHRATLQILVATAGQRLVGIAPMIQLRQSLIPGVSAQLLVPLGWRSADYLTWLIESDWRDQVVPAFLHVLASRPGQLIVWPDIAADDPLQTLIPAAAPSHGLVCRQRPGEVTVQIEFANHWPAIAQSIQRRRRKLSRAFAMDVEQIRQPALLAEAMADFLRLHHAGWQQRGQPGLFQDPQAPGFLADVASRFFQRGWLALAFLRINQQRSAAHFGFQFGQITSGYLYGLGESGEAHKYSPGQVLVESMIEQAHTQGDTTYDYLRGSESYKLRLAGAKLSRNTELTLAKRTHLASQISLALWHSRQTLKTLLRHA